MIPPSIVIQSETIEILEEFLRYAKAGFVGVTEIKRNIGDGLHPDVTTVTFRKSVPLLLEPCPSIPELP